MENKSPILEYSPPDEGRKRGTTSIWIAVAIIAFTTLVLVWDDPFQSLGNEKPVRISMVAGFLGILVAARDMTKWKRSKRPLAGLVLNVLAIIGAMLLLPYL